MEVAESYVPTPTFAPTPTLEASPTKEQYSNDACTVSNEFPDSVRQWCDLIMAYGAEYDVPVNLIASIILQESGGDPSSYSKSGAVGLMQVMPRDGIASSFTCGEDNHPCFRDRPTMEELYNPEFNINYGVRMFAGLLSRYGSVREALFKYGPINMGYKYADIVIAHCDNYGNGELCDR